MWAILCVNSCEGITYDKIYNCQCWYLFKFLAVGELDAAIWKKMRICKMVSIKCTNWSMQIPLKLHLWGNIWTNKFYWEQRDILCKGKVKTIQAQLISTHRRGLNGSGLRWLQKFSNASHCWVSLLKILRTLNIGTVRSGPAIIRFIIKILVLY